MRKEFTVKDKNSNEYLKMLIELLKSKEKYHPIHNFYERMEWAIHYSGFNKIELSRLTGINRRKLSDKLVQFNMMELYWFCYYTGISSDWLLGLVGHSPALRTPVDMTDREVLEMIKAQRANIKDFGKWGYKYYEQSQKDSNGRKD